MKSFPLNSVIYFTHHALMRLPECQIDMIESRKLLQESYSEKNPNAKYKQQKYGESQRDVSYWRNGTIIFTVVKRFDRQISRDSYLVLTMTNQLATLKHF